MTIFIYILLLFAPYILAILTALGYNIATLFLSRNDKKVISIRENTASFLSFVIVMVILILSLWQLVFGLLLIFGDVEIRELSSDVVQPVVLGIFTLLSFFIITPLLLLVIKTFGHRLIVKNTKNEVADYIKERLGDNIKGTIECDDILLVLKLKNPPDGFYNDLYLEIVKRINNRFDNISSIPELNRKKISENTTLVDIVQSTYYSLPLNYCIVIGASYLFTGLGIKVRNRLNCHEATYKKSEKLLVDILK